MSERISRTFWSLAVLVMCCVLTSCSANPFGAGGNASGNQSNSAAANVRKAAVNKEFKEFIVNGLRITVGEVQIEPNKVLINLTVKNETADELTFFPNQHNIAIGNMRLKANSAEGRDVSGRIQPGVEESGAVSFYPSQGKTLSPEEVSTVGLYLGPVFNEKKKTVEAFDAIVTLQ